MIFAVQQEKRCKSIRRERKLCLVSGQAGLPRVARLAAIALVMMLLFVLANVGEAYAQPTVTVIPNPVILGASFQVSGTGFTPRYGVTVDVWTTCFVGPPLLQSVTEVDDSGGVGPVTFPNSGLSVGTYCVWIIDDNNVQGFGSFTVAPTPTLVHYSICVIQSGVQESGGTITWLPGFAYPDTPVSQCQNKTEVLGQDVLGRTIMLHQFIENGTFYRMVTVT